MVKNTGHLIGYARVSTDDQEAQLQLDALEEAGCARVFKDKASGKNTDRPELAAVLDYLRPGDTLCVWKLDRFARSLIDLVTLVDHLAEREVGFKVLTGALAHWRTGALAHWRTGEHRPEHSGRPSHAASGGRHGGV
ncbi:recombinase family protein [Streptomyces sp. NPDC090106]|uniref:recombinase family protein n=1 Tax=Streptomyces sp. NPDC090106 TaxID=3365946 RepID=UPI0038304106